MDQAYRFPGRFVVVSQVAGLWTDAHAGCVRVTWPIEEDNVSRWVEQGRPSDQKAQ